MGMLLALYVARKSKKEFRKLRRKLTFALLKNKIHSLFSHKKGAISTTTLLLILIGVLALTASLVPCAVAAPAGTPCASLKALTISNVTITSATSLPAGRKCRAGRGR